MSTPASSDCPEPARSGIWCFSVGEAARSFVVRINTATGACVENSCGSVCGWRLRDLNCLTRQAFRRISLSRRVDALPAFDTTNQWTAPQPTSQFFHAAFSKAMPCFPLHLVPSLPFDSRLPGSSRSSCRTPSQILILTERATFQRIVLDNNPAFAVE